MTEQEMYQRFGIHSRAWAAGVVTPRLDLPGRWRRNWVHREAARLRAEALLSSKAKTIC